MPSVDPGRFNLQVDGTTKKTDAGDGGTTGPVTVNTGSGHSVGETAGTGTLLSHFVSSISCTRNGSPAEQGNGTTLSGITVNKNDTVVCTITNTRASRPGRMTGGGSVFGTNSFRTTHGFELHCDKNNLPNRLQINWGGGVGAFHLLTLTSAFCFDDPTIGPYPPAAEFDTFVGTGIGRYKDRSNATAEWRPSPTRASPGRGQGDDQDQGRVRERGPVRQRQPPERATSRRTRATRGRQLTKSVQFPIQG